METKINKRKQVVYISGKYSDTNPLEVLNNIERSRKFAIKYWEKGYTVISPHLNTMLFEHDCGIEYDDYMEGYLELLKRCDIIVMIPRWKESEGAELEHNLALKEKKTIIYEDETDDKKEN